MGMMNPTESNPSERIGRIERVALRDVWTHEAHDFTTWLEENIDVLAECVGLNISVVDREHSTGAFSADLIAEDEDGRRVVIENQLEKSDHDHLGKLLTYLVGIEARCAIWIVADPRPEHMGVVAWLNESSSADFFLLKLEAIRIGGSVIAPLVTQIVGPSEETRQVGQAKKEMVEAERLRFRFFEGLLNHAKSKTQLHVNISPSKRNRVGAGSGIAGVTYTYLVRERDACVELYIDTRDGDENTRIFNQLARNRDKIEEVFGKPLEWDTKERRRACSIRQTYRTGGYRNRDKWKAVYDELVPAMVRLESALKPHLEKP